MVQATKYPQSIVQESGTSWRSFKNISHVKDDSNSYAETGLINGKNDSNYKRPARLTCTNFKFSIPVGAKINWIRVEYAHQKIADTKDKYPSIGGPTIFLKNTGIKPTDYVKATGSSPTKSMTAKTKTFNGTYKVNNSITFVPGSNINLDYVSVQNYDSATNTTSYTYKLPNRSTLNNSNFGVEITYPSNTSSNKGYLRIKYIRIVIDYTLSSYSLLCSDNNPIQHHIMDLCSLKIHLSNLKLTDYNTSINITLPENCIFDSGTASNGGSLKKEGNIITWNTNSGTTGTVECILNLQFTTIGTHNITVTELLNNTTKSFDFTIYPTPTGLVEEDNSNEKIIYAKQNTDFIVPIKIPSNLIDNLSYIKVTCNNNIQFNNNATNTTINIPISDFNENGEYLLTCRTNVLGLSYLYISTDSTIGNVNFIIKVIPSNFSYPNCSILSLSNEELDRLGDGYTYTVESFLKIICEIEDIQLFSDYYKNFRMAVFNENIPENLTITPEYLIDNAQYWSSGLTIFNEWEEKTVSFTYNSNNPLYILITGDYMNNHPDEFRIAYTDICIIEDYSEYESSGNFLIPINETIISSSEISISALDHSNSVVIYDFPFEENFGTDDNIAIRGIECVLNVETDNDCVLKAKLKSSYGETGDRSVKINSSDKEIHIGGEFDLWGFSISKMINLEDWSIELQLQNLLNTNNTDVSNITVSDIQIIVYFLPLKKNRVFCIVEGENMRHHGMFLKKPKLSPGLKTKTKYFEIEGSDFNDPASMNITKKEIELEFSVRGCTIEETTDLLREIVTFMTNDRDDLNQPIPKRIEFSHIPGYHFDYILEDPIDEDPKTVGYESKMKLTIYDGTSWANEDTVTNTSGSNDGISKVQPVIECVPLSTTIEITEAIHNQKFTITNEDFNASSIVRIDCANQKAELKDVQGDEWEDISYLVDWDVDWFILYPGEFLFEENGTCLIQNITHTRRGA